jgi:cation diffusion facilitator family transporter
VTVWSFAVMLASIVVDASRSRVLSRAAKKYNSQALEADALHFQTDIWSSSVVIFGLIAVKAGEAFSGWHWLSGGDAVAALGVSAVATWVGVQLGRRTVDALLDSAPAGMEQQIVARVQALEGVKDCHNVRVRYSGSVLFVDLHVLVDGYQTLAQAHELTETIERAIQEIAPQADVTVHPEPF